MKTFGGQGRHNLSMVALHDAMVAFFHEHNRWPEQIVVSPEDYATALYFSRGTIDDCYVAAAKRHIEWVIADNSVGELEWRLESVDS